MRARGSHAVDWLTEQAELAEGLGDFNAARTWREIAVAAKLALSSVVAVSAPWLDALL
jgi:hypothetical protein